jgi:predicted membrane protein
LNTKTNLLRLLYSAVGIALCVVLPFLTMNNQHLGQALSPMHIPALLAGFICGPVYGLAVGAIGPLLRSVLVGQPPLVLYAAAMAFELAAYGAMTGIFYRLLPKKTPYIYITLVVSMILGRFVGGLASTLLFVMGLSSNKLTIAAFFTQYFVGTLPGIILHIIIIPPIVWALKRAKLLASGNEKAEKAVDAE